jgi:DNA-directed RNA polymerase beta subunit
MKSDEYLFDVDMDSNTLKSGIHTANWDLEYEAPKVQKDFVSMYYSASKGYGPEAVPGNYMIELSINEEVLSVPLTVAVDPRWDVSKADLQNQFDIANQVIKLINESQKKLNEMRQITTQIKSYITLTKEKEFSDDIKQLGNKVIEKIVSIESELYQNKIKTSQDEINYARKWTNHITHLYDRITTDIQRPNDGMIKRLDELTKNYNAIISPYKAILENDLNTFTSFLKEKGIAGIIID